MRRVLLRLGVWLVNKYNNYSIVGNLEADFACQAVYFCEQYGNVMNRTDRINLLKGMQGKVCNLEVW
jgi:hypothetical protein